MTNDIKPFLLISLLLHLSFFIVSAVHSKNVIYINMPVELLFSNPPSAVAPAEVVPAPVIKKEKDLAMPKQKKADKKPVSKKAEKNDEAPKPRPAAPPSAAQAVPTANTAVPTSPITLQTARFPYTYYTNHVVKRINRNWQWAQAFGRLKAVVYFKIQRNGRIADIAIKESSGDSLFDQQALRAVSLADPLAQLPDGYGESDLGVFFEFQFKE